MPVSSLPPVADPAAAGRRERSENFPVALRVLPSRVRTHLRAVYAVARLIDDVGDEVDGDRLALLDALEADLRRVWSDGGPQAAVFRALVPTVRACGLRPEPFLALVEANRLDQTVRRYPSYDALRHYCSLSADPVGRIVLDVFGAATPDRVALSDQVCTGLQILEHCQDVAEDRRRDRVYLPLEDLARFRVDELDLAEQATSPQLRGLVEFEVLRAVALLASGARLVGVLRGWARIAVAGYVAGGRAAADALRRADYDVLAATARPRARDVTRHLALLLAGAR